MNAQRERRAAAVIAVLLAGCHGASDALSPAPSAPIAEQTPTSGQSARRIATVRSYGDSGVVEVPATARVGVPVTVAVTTYGGGCIGEDTTVAAVAGAQAQITPYQRIYTPRANEACTLELRITRRSVSVTFPAAGAAQVAVVGRAQPGDSLVRVVRPIAIQ